MSTKQLSHPLSSKGEESHPKLTNKEADIALLRHMTCTNLGTNTVSLRTEEGKTEDSELDQRARQLSALPQALLSALR